MFNEKPSKEEQMAATQVSGCECGGGLIYSVTSRGDNYNQIMLYTLPTTTYVHTCIFKSATFTHYAIAIYYNYVTRLSAAAGRRVQSEQSGYTAHHTRGHSNQALP